MPKTLLSTLTTGLFLFSASVWGQTNACDLAAPFGTVDAADVQAAINMSLGLSPCTANIAGANVCNVMVVQRVVNAIGGTCLTSTGLHMVALTWGASAGAVGYQVYRGTVSGGPYTLLASPSATTYSDYTVVSGVTYYYSVKAVGANNTTSDYSTPIAAPITTP
jgi:hypothetical protein